VTAQTSVADGALAAVMVSDRPLGSGAACHVVPFQFSATGPPAGVAPSGWEVPNAQASLAVGHRDLAR